MFGFGKSKQQKLIETNLCLQQEDSEMRYASSMFPIDKISYPDQVSALLIDNEDKFLDWRQDEKNKERIVLSQRDSDLVEPYGGEPLAFLDEQKGDRPMLNEFDTLLVALYDYRKKYGADDNVDLAFNKIARIRQSFILSSRTTGKPGKLAKSQFVDTTANIKRTFEKPPKKGLGGLLG